MFDFSVVTNWINNLLLSCMPEWAAVLVECILIGVCVLGAYTVLALFYILYERNLCACSNPLQTRTLSGNRFFGDNAGLLALGQGNADN